MSTDTLIVVKAVAEEFKTHLSRAIESSGSQQFELISGQSRQKINRLVQAQWATISHTGRTVAEGNKMPLPLVDNIDDGMDIFMTETFGACAGDDSRGHAGRCHKDCKLVRVRRYESRVYQK